MGIDWHLYDPDGVLDAVHRALAHRVAVNAAKVAPLLIERGDLPLVAVSRSVELLVAPAEVYENPADFPAEALSTVAGRLALAILDGRVMV